jgi:hypothetical protein
MPGLLGISIFYKSNTYIHSTHPLLAASTQAGSKFTPAPFIVELN